MGANRGREQLPGQLCQYRDGGQCERHREDTADVVPAGPAEHRPNRQRKGRPGGQLGGKRDPGQSWLACLQHHALPGCREPKLCCRGERDDRRREEPEAAVSTHHHQAIDRLGTGLVATAWTDDGVIEAAEFQQSSAGSPTAPFMLAVQWHPEAGDDPSLFTSLIAAAC
jgi:hypothetical protein